MVRFSRVWRAVFRMDHPQVRWSVQLMTQDGGKTEQLQGDHEGRPGSTTKSGGMWNFLQQIKDLGLNVTAAFSDDSPSFTEAIKAVWPHARFQADHFHTVKHIWGHLKKALLSSRRQVKASGAEKNDAHLMALAKQVWTLRWALLKKPTNLSR